MCLCIIGVAKSLNVGTNISAHHFQIPFFCKGDEKRITDCIVRDIHVNENLCNDTIGLVTSIMCQTGIPFSIISMLYYNVYYVDRSRTAHTQSCQQ